MASQRILCHLEPVGSRALYEVAILFWLARPTLNSQMCIRDSPEEQEQDFIQLMNVLFRDWWAANDEWDDVTETGSMESIRLRNFLELLGRVEAYFP